MAWSNVSEVGASAKAPNTKSSMRDAVSFLFEDDIIIGEA